MPTNLRTLGVHAINGPTKKAATVTASPFNIGGVVGQFERKYAKAFLVNTPDEQAVIFGNNITSTWYGTDTTTLFWKNLAGSSASLYIKAHVGYTGSAIDAVVASATVPDTNGAPASTLKIEAAYQTNLEYGASGNRTAFAITVGSRFVTALTSGLTAPDTSAVLDSVSGVQVGDYVVLGTAAVARKVVTVSTSTNTITWTGAYGTTANSGEAASVAGFKIHTYRKDTNGVITEVDKQLGQTWCTLEPEVQTYYVQNVFASSTYIKVTDLASASLLLASWPATTAQTFLTSGADGTAPTTANHWSLDLSDFDGLPVRFLCNPETTNVAIQKAGEAYSKNRRDNPLWLTTMAENQTQSQLLTLGANYQRSDDVIQVNVADWLGITDPFNASPIAPDRNVPNVGAVMGAWVRTIATYGIHYIPAIDQITLLGVNSVENTNLGNNITDEARTLIASYGVNLIQNVPGGGIRIRNFFTPSTSLEYRFGNGLLMRNYIKVSSEDSLKSSENYPNSFQRVLEDKNAILNFYLQLWFKGSNGITPTGETFGQAQNTDGTLTDWPDHIQVIADAVNNPASSLQAGERNIDSWFTIASPTGSIQIRVGFLLR